MRRYSTRGRRIELGRQGDPARHHLQPQGKKPALHALEDPMTPRSAIIDASVDELARDLGISRQSAYRGLRDGTIRSVRIGNRYIVAKTAIEEWLRHSGAAGLKSERV